MTGEIFETMAKKKKKERKKKEREREKREKLKPKKYTHLQIFSFLSLVRLLFKTELISIHSLKEAHT